MRSLDFARVLPLVLASAACIPDRDNLQDPAKRPSPQLLVRDLTTGVGKCPELVVGTDGAPAWNAPLDGPSVSTASRGRCLALDARGSSDPDGPRDELSFRWFVEDDELPDSAATLATNGLLVLGTSLRANLPTGVSLTIGVRATDRGGYFAEAETSLTLTRSSPSVRVPSSRTYPLGGFPWLRDLPGGAPDFAVPLRAASLVTDADPSDVTHLVYCWTLPSGTGAPEEVCSRDDDDPAFTLSLASDVPSVTTISLRVSDWPGAIADAVDHPETFSETVFTTVAVREPSLWTRDLDGTVGLERLDPVPSTLKDGMSTLSSSNPILAALVDDGVAPPRIAIIPDNPSVRLVLDELPPASPFERDVALGNGLYAIRLVPDPAHDRVWVLYSDADPGNEPLCPAPPAGPFATLRAFDLDGVEVSCARLPFACEQPVADLAVDGAGNAWVAPRFTGNLARMGPLPGATPVILGTDGPESSISFGLARRPETGELWALRRTAPLWSLEPASMVAVRLDDPGAPPLPLGAETLFGPFWVDDTVFWAYSPAAGVRMLDAPLLEAGASLDAATRLLVQTPEFPDGTTSSAELVDPFSRAFWARRPLDNGAMRIGPDGGLREIVAEDFNPQFVDLEGALWYSEPGGVTGDFVLRRGLTPDRNGVVTSAPMTTLGAAADFDGGGVWAGLVISPGIVRVNEDGSRRDLVQEYIDTDTGLPRAVPAVRTLSLAPDGSSLWATIFAFDGPGAGLLMIDPHTRTGRTVLAADHPDFAALDRADLQVFPASTGADPFAWALLDHRDQGGDLDLVRLDPEDGSWTPAVTIPATEFEPVMAMSPRTNAVCVVTRDEVAGEAVVRIVPAGGPAVEIGRSATTTAASSVTISDEPGAEMCWTSVTDGATYWVEGFFAAGTPAADRSLPLNVAPYAGARPVGLLARSDTEIWVAYENDSGETTDVALFRFTPTAALVSKFTGDRKARFVAHGQGAE